MTLVACEKWLQVEQRGAVVRRVKVRGTAQEAAWLGEMAPCGGVPAQIIFELNFGLASPPFFHLLISPVRQFVLADFPRCSHHSKVGK